MSAVKMQKTEPKASYEILGYSTRALSLCLMLSGNKKEPMLKGLPIVLSLGLHDSAHY